MPGGSWANTCGRGAGQQGSGGMVSSGPSLHISHQGKHTTQPGCSLPCTLHRWRMARLLSHQLPAHLRGLRGQTGRNGLLIDSGHAVRQKLVQLCAGRWPAECVLAQRRQRDARCRCLGSTKRHQAGKALLADKGRRWLSLCAAPPCSSPNQPVHISSPWPTCDEGGHVVHVLHQTLRNQHHACVKEQASPTGRCDEQVV